MPDDARTVPVTLDINGGVAPALDNEVGSAPARVDRREPRSRAGGLQRGAPGAAADRVSVVDTCTLVGVAVRQDGTPARALDLALAAGAERIVSSDHDLPALHPWRGTRILRPAEYLAETQHDP